MVNVNELAVIVAAIIGMAIGAFWYSPAVFGKQWMRLSGITEDHANQMKAKGEMGKYYFAAFVGSLVTSYVLAHIIEMASMAGVSSGISGGLQSAFWTWLGFVVTTLLSSVLWEGKPVKLFGLNIAQCLVAMLVMGGILGAWM